MSPGVLDGGGEGRGTGRVARGQVRHQRGTAELNRLTVEELAIDHHGRPLHVERQGTASARAQHRGVGAGREHARPRHCLHRGMPGDVVCVRVAGQENLHVAEAKSETLHARANQRRRLLEAAVEEKVARWRGDEIDRQLIGADEIDVANDVKRLGRSVPAPHRAPHVRRVMGARAGGRHAEERKQGRDEKGRAGSGRDGRTVGPAEMVGMGRLAGGGFELHHPACLALRRSRGRRGLPR